MQYKQWLDDWLYHYVKPAAKARTYERYASIVENHLKVGLGEYDLDELTPMLLQAFVVELLQRGNRRTNKGLSVNSVNGIITTVKSTLKLARDIGLCKRYVGERIRRPKGRERPVSCFTSAEQKRIERAVLADKRGKMFGVVLCLYTGLRIGELLALEWRDVDLKRGVLSVNKECYDGRDKNGKFCRCIDTPKTSSSRREIPLPKQLLPLLRVRKKESALSLVIVDGKGKGVSVRSYQRSFELLLRRLGVERRNFHALRHTFATRAIECGVDVKTLSELLGHKSPTVTLNRYVHSLNEHKKEMMNRLGKSLQEIRCLS